MGLFDSVLSGVRQASQTSLSPAEAFGVINLGRRIPPLTKWVVVFVFVVFAGCSSFQQSHDVMGRLVVDAEDNSLIWRQTYNDGIGKECLAAHATTNETIYSGITEGTQIVFKNESGNKILGTGVLGKGKIVDQSFYGSCEFPITIKGLLASNVYVVEVASRKGLVLSRQDIESKDWKVDLLLQGDSVKINPHPVIEPKNLKEWQKSREFTKASEEIQTKLADENTRIEQERIKARTCISKQQLIKYGSGETLSDECVKILNGLEESQ
ncbi:hypothetical protein K9N68_33825 [Kovacikia minuta CCNUW1]|uniref:hypothetical protein n=1 Tax=Kovacikia minuta TaxID=2931930 RepID=UPI001CCEDDE8|nr:hypothetical protein [Kovacikia minuta]UBF26422.1 hypothetical protein K9N68_33825 [Kovacikia minuta CCNUW1]